MKNNKDIVTEMYTQLQKAYIEKIDVLIEKDMMDDSHVVGWFKIINAHLNKFRESISEVDSIHLSVQDFEKDYNEILSRIKNL